MTPHVHENPARAPVIRNGEDDAAIIRVSLQRSDQFAELFRRHAPAVRRYATRRIGPDAAEDIVAETFLTAFRRRDSYDLSHPDARPWLFGIATRLIGRHRRSEVRLYQALARTGVMEPAGRWRRRWPGCRPDSGMCCCWWPGVT